MRVCAYACVDSNIFIDSVFKDLIPVLPFASPFSRSSGKAGLPDLIT